MPFKNRYLIAKCRSWDEFVELVNSIPKSKNKESTAIFSNAKSSLPANHASYASKLKNVYLLNDKTIPERLLMSQAEPPEKRDEGTPNL